MPILFPFANVHRVESKFVMGDEMASIQTVKAERKIWLGEKTRSYINILYLFIW